MNHDYQEVFCFIWKVYVLQMQLISNKTKSVLVSYWAGKMYRGWNFLQLAAPWVKASELYSLCMTGVFNKLLAS